MIKLYIISLNMQSYKRLLHPSTGQLILPTEYPDYSSLDYWNARYLDERGQTYDWYLPWKSAT